MESHDEPHDDAATWARFSEIFLGRIGSSMPGNFVTKISSLWPRGWEKIVQVVQKSETSVVLF